MSDDISDYNLFGLSLPHVRVGPDAIEHDSPLLQPLEENEPPDLPVFESAQKRKAPDDPSSEVI